MLDYFDIIYIINLPNRTDRRKEIKEQFSNIGIDIDGERVRFFSAIRPDVPNGFSSVGARGCFLSHLAVLSDARGRCVSNVLIIEDDCNFVNSFLEKVHAIQTNFPRDSWSFFYGGALNELESTKVRGVWLAPDQPVGGTHFIAVNGKVLGCLVSYFEAILTRPAGDPLGGPMHVDGAYSWFRESHPDCATYLAIPEIAYQRSSATDIHQRKWYESMPLMQWILGYLRMLKNIIRNVKRW